MSTFTSSEGGSSAPWSAMPAEGAADVLVSINPATLQPLGETPITPPNKLSEIASAARAAQTTWGRLTYKERGKFLLRARRYLLDHMDDFAFTITQENGKPLVESLTAECYPIADLLYYFAHRTGTILRPYRVWTGLMDLLGRHSWIGYRPRGVIGIISPWNYPFSIPAGCAAMAIAAGNTVLLKPSSVTSLVGQKIAEMFEAAGLPDHVFNHLPGNATTGEAVCESEIDKLVFTGSVSVGKEVMAACAARCIPSVMELGGKDAMIVLADADLELAASGAVWGAFTNAGQCCASVERAYVHANIAEQFIKLVVEKTARLKQGVGTDVDVEIGPLTTAAQLEIVEKQVEEARRRGAKVLIGGERNSAFPGYFYKPTVLTNVDHSMEIMAEETFGPLLPIMMFADDQEAIRLANDTKFGLTASIWTRDMKAARAMARELRAGTVTINECLYTHAICQTPWGGRGWSGFGRTHGRLGLLELVEPHHIHVNAMARFKSFWWYPYDQQLYTLFRNFTRRITGGWLGKLWHLPKILKATKTVKL